MKSLNWLAALSICASASAGAAGRISSPEDITVTLVNDASADSWAEVEGVRRVDFTQLKCDFQAAKCELAFKLKRSRKPPLTDKCEIKKITGYDDLFEVVKYGLILKSGVYDQIDACMNPLL